MSAKLVPTLADRGCRVVSATESHGRILGFIDRSRYYFFQIAPQLYSRGWVDPVPDPLLLRKSGSDGNRTRDLCICSQELWPLDHRGGALPSNNFVKRRRYSTIAAARERLGDTMFTRQEGIRNTGRDVYCAVRAGAIKRGLVARVSWYPCGGGFEYLHRDPASRRRRQKGESQIWDSKIWSRVPRDSDPRKTTLARASSIYKRQTRPWGSTPRLTDWLTVSHNVTLTLSQLRTEVVRSEKLVAEAGVSSRTKEGESTPLKALPSNE
jgi:hypothetical protein